MKNKTVLLIVMIVLAALSRLMPHPNNFAPITGLALFSGFQFGKNYKAFLVPIVAMFISDTVLQYTTGYGYWDGMWVVYLTFILITLFSQVAIKTATFPNLFWVSLVSSCIFFVITNFATYVSSGMYQHNFAGLTQCFVAAIPFFSNTIAGDLFYTVSLFAGFGLLVRNYPKLLHS